MAWGRKAKQIENFRGLLKGAEERSSAYRIAAAQAQDEVFSLRRANDKLKRQRDQDNREHGREQELLYAAHLLNAVLSNRTGTSESVPVDELSESSYKAAKKALRERDVVVKWDDLNGTASIHFPKKSERRAPWAGMYAAGGMVDVDPAKLDAAATLFDPAGRRRFTSNHAPGRTIDLSGLGGVL